MTEDAKTLLNEIKMARDAIAAIRACKGKPSAAMWRRKDLAVGRAQSTFDRLLRS